MNASDVRTTVRNWLLDASGETNLDDAAHLVDSGIIQSLLVLRLVGFVSDTFGVEVTADDVYAGKLASVDAIVEFVIGKPS